MKNDEENSRSGANASSAPREIENNTTKRNRTIDSHHHEKNYHHHQQKQQQHTQKNHGRSRHRRGKRQRHKFRGRHRGRAARRHASQFHPSWIDQTLWNKVYCERLVGEEVFVYHTPPILDPSTATTSSSFSSPSDVTASSQANQATTTKASTDEFDGISSSSKENEWFLSRVKSILPSNEQVKTRRVVLRAVKDILTKTIPGVEVGIFGSTAVGVDIVDSDIDLIIFFRCATHPIDVHAVLRDVEVKLREECETDTSDIRGKCTFISSSKVPVIKLDTDMGPSIDISCQNPWTLVGVRFVRHFLKCCPLLASLVRVVKLWVSKRNIRPSRYGGLSSWGWTLLVIFAYQQKPQTFDEYATRGDLVSMVSEFFSTYTTKISLRKPSVLSLRTGRFIPKDAFVNSMVPPAMKHLWASSSSFLSIEEPVVRPPVDIAAHIGDDVLIDTDAELWRAHVLLQLGTFNAMCALFLPRVDRSQTISLLCAANNVRTSSEAATSREDRRSAPCETLIGEEKEMGEEEENEESQVGDVCFAVLSRKEMHRYVDGEKSRSTLEAALEKNGRYSSSIDGVVCLAIREKTKQNVLTESFSPLKLSDKTGGASVGVETKGRCSPLDARASSAQDCHDATVLSLRLLSCCDASGQRPFDSAEATRLHRFRLTDLVVAVPRERVLFGVSVLVQGTEGSSSLFSPWTRFALDPAETLNLRKIGRILERQETMFARRRHRECPAVITKVDASAKSDDNDDAIVATTRPKRADRGSLASREDIMDFVSPLKRRRS